MTPVAKRMTAAEKANAARLRDLKHLAEVAVSRPSRGSESSVSVTRNAKGQWQFAVEVAHADPNEAYSNACDIAEALNGRFPYQNGAE